MLKVTNIINLYAYLYILEYTSFLRIYYFMTDLKKRFGFSF